MSDKVYECSNCFDHVGAELVSLMVPNPVCAYCVERAKRDGLPMTVFRKRDITTSVAPLESPYSDVSNSEWRKAWERASDRLWEKYDNEAGPTVDDVDAELENMRDEKTREPREFPNWEDL